MEGFSTPTLRGRSFAVTSPAHRRAHSNSPYRYRTSSTTSPQFNPALLKSIYSPESFRLAHPPAARAPTPPESVLLPPRVPTSPRMSTIEDTKNTKEAKPPVTKADEGKPSTPTITPADPQGAPKGIASSGATGSGKGGKVSAGAGAGGGANTGSGGSASSGGGASGSNNGRATNARAATGTSTNYKENETVNGIKLTAAMANLLNTLGEINGQDAYSTETAIMGKLTTDEYLRLPDDIKFPEIDAANVGHPDTPAQFSLEFIVQVYALNKAVAKEEAVKFALARMEAVKMGWVDLKSQKEIKLVPSDPDAFQTFFSDLGEKAALIATAQKVAWLTPLAAEFVFRTLGHHYVTSTAATYRDRYKRIFDSSLEPDINNFLPADHQFHRAFHWIGPKRIRDVLTAQLHNDIVPDAVRLRYYAAPAGTALITTTAAVLESMKASGYYDVLKAESKCDLDRIIAKAAEIKANPPKFHRVPHAYGLPPLSAAEAKEIDVVKAEAAKFAPVAQGYIDALLANAALGKAMVLAKHANDHPMLKQRMTRLFRALARAPCKSIHDAFRVSLDVPPPPPVVLRAPAVGPMVASAATT